MKRLLGTLILVVFGWKAKYPTEYKIQKMVMIAAPHTSNWDLLFTFAAYWKEGLDPKFLIYKKYTKGFFGFFFKKLGALSLDKDNYQSIVDYSVDLFEEKSAFLLLITPEGTKHKADKWKTGFFNIAKLANVPLCLGLLDYESKEAGIGGLLSMTGDFQHDMMYIQKFYEKANPKYPRRYNKRIF